MFDETSLRSDLSVWKFREAVADMLRSEARNNKSSFALTLAFNRPVTSLSSHRTIMHFSALIDRQCLGPRYHLVNRDRRMSGLMVNEYGRSYGKYHLHGIASVMPRFEDKFLTLAKKKWKQASVHGTISVKPIDDLEGWVDYVLKNATEKELDDFVYF